MEDRQPAGARARPVLRKKKSSRRKGRPLRGGSPGARLRALRLGVGVLLVAAIPFTASCNLGELAISLGAMARGLGTGNAVALADLGDLAGGQGNVALRRDLVSYLRQHHTGLSRLEEVMLADGILRAARESHTDYRLILALIQVESTFSNWARSSQGALGLMQVMPATGRLMARELDLPWAGTATLFDPITNVQIGTSYLARMRSRYGDLGTALMAYNRGPGALEMQDEIDPSADAYVTKVLGHYHRLLRRSAQANARLSTDSPST